MAASDTDWFDELFAQDELFPASDCKNKLTETVRSETTDTMDLDVFLECSSSGSSDASTKKKQESLGHGLDDLVFADFGNW